MQRSKERERKIREALEKNRNWSPKISQISREIGVPISSVYDFLRDNEIRDLNKHVAVTSYNEEVENYKEAQRKKAYKITFFGFNMLINALLVVGGFASFFTFCALYGMYEANIMVGLAVWSMVVTVMFSYAYVKEAEFN